MSNQQTFGKLIRQKREESGASINAMAKLSGISLSNLSDLETGKVVPTLNTMLRLAAAMKLNIYLGEGIQVFRRFEKMS